MRTRVRAHATGVPASASEDCGVPALCVGAVSSKDFESIFLSCYRVRTWHACFCNISAHAHPLTPSFHKHVGCAQSG